MKQGDDAKALGFRGVDGALGFREVDDASFRVQRGGWRKLQRGGRRKLWGSGWTVQASEGWTAQASEFRVDGASFRVQGRVDGASSDFAI